MNWLVNHGLRSWLVARLSTPSKASTKLLTQFLPLAIVVVGLVLMALDPAPVKGLRNGLFDQYQRWQPRTYVDVPVRIIDIDEESLHRLGQWPWPRTRVADMIETMRGAGAAAIGFDVVFAEADRTSPPSMASLWLDKSPTDGAALRELLRQLPEHDQVMTQALSGGGVILGFTLGPAPDEGPGATIIGMPQGKSGDVPSGLPTAMRTSAANALTLPAPYALKGGDPQNALYRFGSVVPSLMAFQRAAAGNGVLTFIPDEDGVLRRVPLALRYGVQTVPSFTAEMLRVSQGAKSTVLTSAESLGGGTVGLQEVRIGAHVVPTTAQGEAWVHFTRSQPSRYIPAWRVLAGEVPADSLKGKLLLVGSSAQGLMDLRVSPLGHIIPGVEVHAQALEQMLTDQHLTRPSWASPAEMLLMLVIGLAVGLLALHARSILAAGLTLMTLASLFSAAWLAFSQYQVLFNPMMPALVVLASFGLCSLVHHFMSEQQQRWLTDAFARYVSPNKVAFLVKHPEGLELGGSRQMCSFIFTDLQGFTTLMENMDPGEAVTSLNAYLDGMVAIAFKHEGTLDRIMGDAVAVVFSAPVKQADHKQRAFDCALEMHAFSKQYAAEQQAQGVRFGNTRIGVHSGEVIVGNFGGTHMFDYRALGDPVNTAARLESVNKHLGTLFCMSEAIYNGCPEAVARPVGRLVLKGKKVPLMVYEPVVLGDELTRVPLTDYKEAYALLAAQRVNGLAAEDGLRAFATLAKYYPNDPLIRLHLERMQRGETGDEIVMADK